MSSTTLNGSTVKGTKEYGAAAPTSSAVRVVDNNDSRSVIALFNNHATATVYLGNDASVTSSNGYPLAAGDSLEDTDSYDAWWAVMASGTGDVRWIEVVH